MTEPDSIEKQKLPQSRIPGWVKTLLPIIVSAGILYYYFRSQDWGKLLDTMSDAYVPLAVLGIAGPQLVIWYTFSLIAHRHLRWFHGEIPLRDLFFVKGATYLLSLINNPLAGGGFFVYQMKKADISVRKLAGIALFRGGMTMWGFNVYLAIATAATQYYGLGLGERLNLTVLWIFIIFNMAWMIEAWIFWHYDKNIGIGKYLVKRNDEFWSCWAISEKKHWWYTWAAILPSVIFMFLGYYAIALSFGIDVPFFKFMAMIPLVLFISNLPVAMGGFGTTTMAWVMFFPEYNNDPRLLALSLFIPTARMIVRAIFGAFSLPFALKDLSTMTAKS